MSSYIRRNVALLLAAASLIAPRIQAQQEVKQITADQLVAKNIEAKGGAEAVHALETVKFTGKVLVNQGQLQMAYSETKKRPGSVREEFTLQGMTAVQSYNGEDGWKIMPFQGRKDPEKMSADETKSLTEDAQMAGPLVDWKEKGSTVEYLGTEDVDGTQAHKLKVTLKNGDVQYVYLDPEYFLEIRIISQRVEHGAQVETETDLSDYEKVDGVFLPFSLETGPKGASDKQKTILDKAEGNVPVDDAIFRFPTVAK